MCLSRYPVVEAQRVSDVLAEQHAVAVCRKAEELLTQLQQSSPPPDATLLRSVDVKSRLFPPTCTSIMITNESSPFFLLPSPPFSPPLSLSTHVDLLHCSRQHITNKQTHLSQLQSEMQRLARGQLPGLIQETATLQVSKVLHGDYSLKIARQDYFTSKQDKVIYIIH